MPLRKFARAGAGAALAAWLLLACTLTRAVIPAATPPLTETPALPTDVPSDGWAAIAPGVAWRAADLPTASLLSSGSMVLVRLDPAQAEIRVHYSPGAGLLLSEWRAQLPAAVALVNGGFFDEAGNALGLLASDGQMSGASFSGFGGMLQVDTAGAARVRSLVSEPYWGEPLWQAVQAFPMLIEAGGLQAPQGEGFDVRSRRTWVGQDWSGRVVFGITPNLISLADLQAWLMASDLNLAIAFALDGGRSAGMALDLAEDWVLQSFDRLPTVIAVYSR